MSLKNVQADGMSIRFVQFTDITCQMSGILRLIEVLVTYLWLCSLSSRPLSYLFVD